MPKTSKVKAADVKEQAESKKVQEKPAKEENAQKKEAFFLNTTLGKRIDRIDVQSKDGKVSVSASYGSLKEGKNVAERREGMRHINGELSKEQQTEYSRLARTDKNQALEYAVKAAFPYHLDDAKFKDCKGEVNGKQVNAVEVRKITEKDALDPKNVGKYSIKAGMQEDGKWVKGSMALNAIMKPDEKDRYFKRQVRPLDLANEIAVNRQAAKESYNESMAQRSAKNAELDKKVAEIDFSKYYYPKGSTVEGVRTYRTEEADKQNRLMITGVVNGVKVNAMLTEVQSHAIYSGKATLEQAFMSNASIRKEAFGLNKEFDKEIKFADAVEAIFERGKDPVAKSFTLEQKATIDKALSKDEDREVVVSNLWVEAEKKLDKENVNDQWKADTKAELDDIAKGQWVDRSQEVSQGR